LLPVDEWSAVEPGPAAPFSGDILWHYQQSYTFSQNASFEQGKSVHTYCTSSGSRVSDMGGCTCYAHGGIEIGGGVLQANSVLPLAPGQTSPVDTRFLLFPQGPGSLDLIEQSVNTP